MSFSTDHQLQKVQLLLHQENYAVAEELLHNLLREQGDDGYLLYLLAETKLQQEQPEAAETLTNRAIALAPDKDWLYQMKARICLHKDDWAGAAKWIDQAIQLDPEEADYFALKAQILLGQKKFAQALSTADEALALDASNLLALNTRSTALHKLGRNTEAMHTVEMSLREDPNNAFTHANVGWGLLEAGHHRQAMDHFKESLSLDPRSVHAQAGMVEAIKTTNPAYRLFLRYSFWMGNLRANHQWAVLIGFFVISRLLRTVNQQYPAFQPFLYPLIIALAAVAYSTWIMQPLSNLFLRFHRQGRWLLDRKERLSAEWVGMSLLLAIVGLGLGLALSQDVYLNLTIVGVGMVLPLGNVFSPARNRWVLPGFAIGLGLIGAMAVIDSFVDKEFFSLPLLGFLLCLVIYQWVANYQIIKATNH